jgi:hypothetical protein
MKQLRQSYKSLSTEQNPFGDKELKFVDSELSNATPSIRQKMKGEL